MRIRRAEVVLFAQMAAIVLPVAALSAIAWNLERQDRAAVIALARQNAQEQIPAALARVQQSVRNLAHSGTSATIREGTPLVAGDYSAVPAPGSESPAAVAALERMEKGAPGSATQQALAIVARYRGAETAAGTPVADLALLLALRRNRGPLPEALSGGVRRQVAEAPSFLSAELVRTANIPALTSEWERMEGEREEKRAILRQIAASLVAAQGPSFVRIPQGNRSWLALCDPAPDGWSLKFGLGGAESQPLSGVRIAMRIDQTAWDFGPAIASPVEIAAVEGLVDVPGNHRYRIVAQMAPGVLEKRTRFMQVLILFAGIAGLLGAAAIWTGYRRQMRLAELQSNFVSSVSHELRAPLAAVRLMAESLESGRVSENGKQRDYFRLIVQECRRLSTLVENALDVSRIQTGREVYRCEPVDVAALVRHSVALMQPCAAERQVELRLGELPPDGLGPSWDASAVEQALVNLLDNAIKHSPPGEAVEVTSELDQGRIRVWVADRGPGIPAGEQQRIFDLFYRHGSELRRETKGTGIGLYIARHVAEAHGGRVVLESEPGHGSRFALELPAERRV